MSSTPPSRDGDSAGNGLVSLEGRVWSWSQAEQIRAEWRSQALRVVFTNGCFDILHAGHVTLLEQARRAGDRLVVGLNDDDSVRRLKGSGRPVNQAGDRAAVLAALRAVDGVVLFPQDTPLALIQALAPDVLVKGGDYAPDDIVGAEWVRARGGEVRVVPLVEGKATTRIVGKIREGVD
jgi:rfaE bifunctional protein nucleotidyltransferase chain/domain